MIKMTDHMPPFDEDLRVIVYTDGKDFAGQQFFDVKVKDLYPADEHHQHYGEYSTEIAEAATHWFHHPRPGSSVEVENFRRGLLDSFKALKDKAPSVRDMIYLDAVMAVVSTYGTDQKAPDPEVT